MLLVDQSMLKESKLKERKRREKKPEEEKPRDTAAIYGPSDKHQHFLNDEDDFKAGKKKKGTSPSNKPQIGRKIKAKI